MKIFARKFNIGRTYTNSVCVRKPKPSNQRSYEVDFVLARLERKSKDCSRYARRKEEIVMAIYSFNVKMVSRANNQNVIASAAYRSGEKLKDYATGETKRYKAREVEPENMILAPSYAPSWVYNREQLWNAVEASEKRVNSQLARSFMVALPVEFSRQEQREVIMKFAQENFVDKGMIADIAIHRDDKGNPHAHILTTTRHIDSEKGFTTKERSWNAKDLHNGWREDWEKVCNEKLVEIGYEDRLISHKSYADRNLDYVATVHLGYKENALKLKGIKTERAVLNEQITQYNAQLKQLKKETEKAKTEELYEKMSKRNHVLIAVKQTREGKGLHTDVSKEIYSKTFTDEYKDLTQAYYAYAMRHHEGKNMDGNLFYAHLIESKKSTESKLQSVEERTNKTIEKREGYMQFMERQRGMLQRAERQVRRLSALDKRIHEYEHKFFGLGVILYSKNIQKALIEKQGILKSRDVQNYLKFTQKHGIYTEKDLNKALHDTKESIHKYKLDQQATMHKLKQGIADKDKQITQMYNLAKDVHDFSKEMAEKRAQVEIAQKQIANMTEKVNTLSAEEQEVSKALEQAPKSATKAPVVQFDQATEQILQKHERLKEIAPYIANDQTFAKLATRYNAIESSQKEVQSVFETFQKQIKMNNSKIEEHFKSIQTYEMKISSATQEKSTLENEVVKRQERVGRLSVVNAELEKNEGVTGKLKAFASKEFKQKQDSLRIEKDTLERSLNGRTESKIRDEIKQKEEQIKRFEKQLHDLRTSNKPKELEKDNAQLQEFSKVVEPYNEQQRSIAKEIQRSRDFERGR